MPELVRLAPLASPVRLAQNPVFLVEIGNIVKLWPQPRVLADRAPVVERIGQIAKALAHLDLLVVGEMLAGQDHHGVAVERLLNGGQNRRAVVGAQIDPIDPCHESVLNRRHRDCHECLPILLRRMFAACAAPVNRRRNPRGPAWLQAGGDDLTEWI